MPSLREESELKNVVDSYSSFNLAKVSINLFENKLLITHYSNMTEPAG